MSTVATSTSARTKANPGPPRAILVTIDGVRWQDLFEGPDRSMLSSARVGSLTGLGIDEFTREGREGLLPRTWELVSKSGVALGHGAGCGTVRPRNMTNISLPGYFEIFTAQRTLCMSNVCPRVTMPTVLDAAAAAGLSAASISSWEMLDMAATRSFAGGGGNPFVAAGTKWPGALRSSSSARLDELAAEGEKAKPFPAPSGTYRPDRFTGAIALEYLRVHRPRMLHIGLGDVDEHGHRDDYPAYLAALHDSDVFLGDLAEALEALGLFESTTVIVTTDHGRATSLFREHGPSYPESGRAFVIAFGGRVPRRGEACASRDLWLTDIAPTLRAVLGLPRDPSLEAIGKPIEEIVQR